VIGDPSTVPDALVRKFVPLSIVNVPDAETGPISEKTEEVSVYVKSKRLAASADRPTNVKRIAANKTNLVILHPTMIRHLRAQKLIVLIVIYLRRTINPRLFAPPVTVRDRAAIRCSARSAGT
jgi:hypothetical protein